MKISLVVPCYNEELTIEKFYQTATPVLSGMGIDYEIIFVNDGSTDNSRNILTTLSQKDERVKVVNFSRNFGQQAAIFCGFKYSTGDCVAELDCDLQDPVELIPEMYSKFLQGYDVVHGRRKKRRGESLFKRATASAYYKFLSRISWAKMPRDTGDFKLLSRRVVDVICNLPEHEKYLRGLESWVGFKQTFVDFDRHERVAGKTHYSLKKMAKLATAGIVSNSNYPLTLSLKFGVILAALSVFAFIALIVLSIVKVPFEGFLWLVPTVCLLFSGSYIFNGISNLYLANVNNETKNRPEFIVEDTFNI